MKIACVHSNSERSREGHVQLAGRYDLVAPDESEVIVVLGGDGMLLHSIHRFRELGVPIYGMNRGTVGFLMNPFHLEDLPERLAKADPQSLAPLRMRASTTDGGEHEALAFNEVSVIRYSGQSANLRVCVDGRERVPKLICDGILVATPAGSTAYNLSAHGPILPIEANVLAMTPVSPFRPRRWRGALLPRSSEIVIENLDPGKRPIGGSADSHEVRDVASLTVTESPEDAVTILFDPGHTLDERVLAEQFAHG